MKHRVDSLRTGLRKVYIYKKHQSSLSCYFFDIQRFGEKNVIYNKKRFIKEDFITPSVSRR